MAFHDDLLEQARHLANRERKQPRQASLRRAISSGYYALFHLLIAEAVSKWEIAAQRPQLARIFEHARMNAASERVLNVRLFPFTGQDPALVAHLKRIARTFSRSYEQRQMADYDNARHWVRTEVLDLIDTIAEAFQSVKAIRGEAIGNDYLLSLFLKERR
ncbi:conserved hypothetical protein [Candidatus Sulfopaludibacter sp. SbA4]|nr:conserved hypothetical protein [Candidatus Sulfopaludibacter sp. SbA4]